MPTSKADTQTHKALAEGFCVTAVLPTSTGLLVSESTSGQRNWELQTAELFTAPRSCQMKSIPGCAPKSIQKCTRQRNISGRIHSFFLRTIQALLSPQPPLTVQEQARISLISWTGTWKRHQFTPEAGALSSQPKCSGCVLEAVTKPSAFKSPCRAGVTPA